MENLTAKEVKQLDELDIYTKEMKFGSKVQELIDGLNGTAKEGSPVNAVNATNVLTIAGVVVDGETMLILNPEEGEVGDIYEFCADAAQSVTVEGNIPVDISASATASSGTLTVDTQPTSGDTLTIGDIIYTFVPDGTDNAEGEISVGTDLATAQVNIVAAINGTDGFNTANPYASAGAFDADASTITALVGGTVGDTIATTETFTAVTNIFAAVALGGGVDCSAANAITALVGAITASDTQGVGAVDGAGDTIDLTADVAGVIGNAIQVSTDLANGTFDTETLEGGVNGTIGVTTDVYIDATYLYRCVAENTIADKNWRRIALGSAY